MSPLTQPQNGAVLAAGRARGQAALGFSWRRPSSVGMMLSASRVRFAGLGPPLTRPYSPSLEPIHPLGIKRDRIFTDCFRLAPMAASGRTQSVTGEQIKNLTSQSSQQRYAARCAGGCTFTGQYHCVPVNFDVRNTMTLRGSKPNEHD